VKAATDLGTRLNAVLGIAKAVAMLTQRREIGPSVSTATGIVRRAAGWAARGQTATPAGTELRVPALTPRGSARRREGALALPGTGPRVRATRQAARGPAAVAEHSERRAAIAAGARRAGDDVPAVVRSRPRRGSRRRGPRRILGAVQRPQGGRRPGARPPTRVPMKAPVQRRADDGESLDLDPARAGRED